MKLFRIFESSRAITYFSALGRAVWDETSAPVGEPVFAVISVLSVEPYGMKPSSIRRGAGCISNFSALGRAVWDETPGARPTLWQGCRFQCSRSSRMG